MTTQPQPSTIAARKTAAYMRWMIRRDMPSVLDIEEKTFEFPWTEQDFLLCLRQGKCIGMVADDGEGEVLGFVIYQLHKDRLHILNLAVDHVCRREGVGKLIMDKIVSKLSWDRRNRITLEVRETNLQAQLFFKSLGFRAVSIMKNFYDDTTEDAYLMQLRCEKKKI